MTSMSSSSASASASASASSTTTSSSSFDYSMSFVERAISAAGAAFLSAIIVNPLDVAKTRLQAQAAQRPYKSLENQTKKYRVGTDIRQCPSVNYGGRSGPATSHPSGYSQYKGTIDVFHKIIRQEGLSILWRGTNASLLLAVPTVGIYLPCYDVLRNWMEDITSESYPNLNPYAPIVAGSAARTLACIACSPLELAKTRMQAFKVSRTGGKPPGVWKTLLGVLSQTRSESYIEKFKGYRSLWTGVGAQLSRDVPFSAICWSTLEPIRNLLLVGGESDVGSLVAANFLAGYVAGSLAAAATCPLDVAKTRRQIEKDPERVLKTTTRQTLAEIWRYEGIKGLFAGVRPRVARAGPSVAIVVSFYEVVKYSLHEGHVNK